MDLITTSLDGVYVINPKIYDDSRGWFMESYNKKILVDKGICVDFIQDNHSLSTQRHTIRGLHFQKNPKAQAKLVRCIRGSIIDVAVDIRKGSPTYKKWIAVELSDDNKKELFVPKGFAHGFVTLTDNVEIQYKVDEYYSPIHDRSIRFDDCEIGINWGIKVPILSDKDINAPLFKDCDHDFKY